MRGRRRAPVATEGACPRHPAGPILGGREVLRGEGLAGYRAGTIHAGAEVPAGAAVGESAAHGQACAAGHGVARGRPSATRERPASSAGAPRRGAPSDPPSVGRDRPANLTQYPGWWRFRSHGRIGYNAGQHDMPNIETARRGLRQFEAKLESPRRRCGVAVRLSASSQCSAGKIGPETARYVNR